MRGCLAAHSGSGSTLGFVLLLPSWGDGDKAAIAQSHPVGAGCPGPESLCSLGLVSAHLCWQQNRSCWGVCARAAQGLAGATCFILTMACSEKGPPCASACSMLPQDREVRPGQQHLTHYTVLPGSQLSASKQRLGDSPWSLEGMGASCLQSEGDFP